MIERTFSVGGYSFKGVIDGVGPALLFVHGSVADYATFHGMIARLSNSFKCVAYSRRFHPPNAPAENADVYDTMQQAQDMLEIIAATGISPVVLVGSSFGAYVGLIAAILAPGKFRALVLCEPPMVPLLLYHPEGKLLHDEFVGTVMNPARDAFRRGDEREGLRIFVEGVRGQPGWFNRLFPSMRAELMRFAPELKAEFLSEYRRYMWEVSLDSLRGMPVPTHLLGGELSTPMFSRILDVLEGSIPGARRVQVPGAGHLIHMQNPDALEVLLRKIAVKEQVG